MYSTKVIEMNPNRKRFELYFSDLNEDAQRRLLEYYDTDDPAELNIIGDWIKDDWSYDKDPLIALEKVSKIDWKKL